MKESAGKSATRAFDILEYFQVEQRPLALKDVVRELGLPMSSGEELLKSLCHGGYLCFDPTTRTYMPTPKVTRLGLWVPGALLMQGRLEASARRLNDLSGEMTAIATANELTMQNIAFQPPRHPVDIEFHPENTFPLVVSAMGIAWLSHEREERIERLYRQSIARRIIDRTDFPLERLLCRVEAVRGRDVAVIQSSWQTGMTMLAITIDVPQAQRRMVMSIGGPEDRIKPRLDQFREALLAERSMIAHAA